MIRKILSVVIAAILIAGIVGGIRAINIYKEDAKLFVKTVEKYLEENS